MVEHQRDSALMPRVDQIALPAGQSLDQGEVAAIALMLDAVGGEQRLPDAAGPHCDAVALSRDWHVAQLHMSETAFDASDGHVMEAHPEHGKRCGMGSFVDADAANADGRLHRLTAPRSAMAKPRRSRGSSPP